MLLAGAPAAHVREPVLHLRVHRRDDHQGAYLLPLLKRDRVSLRMSCNASYGFLRFQLVGLWCPVQVLAHGLLLGSEAYLRTGWNLMDGTIVVVSLIDAAFYLLSPRQDLGILGVLRVFRMLRALRPLRHDANTRTSPRSHAFVAFSLSTVHCAEFILYCSLLII